MWYRAKELRKQHLDVVAFEPQKVFFINLKLGFKVEHNINRMFAKIVENMQSNSEVDEFSHYPSLY